MQFPISRRICCRLRGHHQCSCGLISGRDPCRRIPDAGALCRIARTPARKDCASAHPFKHLLALATPSRARHVPFSRHLWWAGRKVGRDDAARIPDRWCERLDTATQLLARIGLPQVSSGRPGYWSHLQRLLGEDDAELASRRSGVHVGHGERGEQSAVGHQCVLEGQRPGCSSGSRRSSTPSGSSAETTVSRVAHRDLGLLHLGVEAERLVLVVDQNAGQCDSHVMPSLLRISSYVSATAGRSPVVVRCPRGGTCSGPPVAW